MTARSTIGNRVAPPRFLAFGVLLLAVVPLAAARWGWTHGTMIGFDVAAGIFILSCAPLFGMKVDAMRETAQRNDANRAELLALSAVVTLAVLAAVAAELTGGDAGRSKALAVATLVIAWIFANLVYTLHYAHLFYRQADGGDAGGLDVPDTSEPDYGDFAYFAFTLGMTFQTSDITIRSAAVRRVALMHSMLAFVFNLGVIALTINLLGN